MDRIEAYYKSDRLNASTLKGLHNPKWIKFQRDNPDAEDEEKRHFRIGSAIDAILTSPGEFEKTFAVSYRERPGGLMGIFIDALPLDLDSESDIEEYREAYDKSGYKTSIETIVKKLWEVEKFKDYYLSRKNGAGKTILSYDEYEEVMHCKEYLLNNPFTSEYFINTNPTQDVFHQVPIYFTYYLNGEPIKCKALLDGVIIDHLAQTIQIFDLKTIGRSVKTFPTSFLRYGYYLQGAFYQLAFSEALHDRSGESYFDVEKLESLKKDIETYESLPVQFVVTEKKTYHSNPARIYQCTDNDMVCGYKGGRVNGQFYPGIYKLIEDFYWHESKNYWDMPKWLVDSGGKVEIDIFDKHDVNANRN